MEEIGKIIEIKGDFAIIKMESKEQCKNCGHCISVSTFDGFIMEINNNIKAHVGDRVKISIPEKTILYASFIVYFIPLVFIFIGYFTGVYFADFFHFNISLETAGIIASISGLFISLIFIRKFEIKTKDKNNFLPKIIEILPDTNTTTK
ncbi:MAG: SoxR reducing system RseC family protein [Candidatus Firestonebacteria bacterium]|nr:SoxR reducing system RseC family protein [Candidatus Firestonebacteria bacterium]